MKSSRKENILIFLDEIYEITNTKEGFCILLFIILFAYIIFG